MNQIAVFYGSTTIYFNSILIALALVAAFIFSLAIYLPRNRYAVAMWLFFPMATGLSVILSRIIHWYCNIEQYADFRSALTDYTSGDYCITGVIIAVWFVALLLWCLHITRSRFDLLDAAAPGLAFVLAVVRFTHIFSDKCYGKTLIEAPSLQRLPLAAPIVLSDGTIEYRFASFFISAIVLFAISIFLTIFYINKRDRFFAERASKPYDSITRRAAKSDGHVFRMFLLLFSAEEVVIDSTRYDATHLFFRGEQFAGINKATSFMGLSQFVSALILLYLFIYYLVVSINRCKKTGRSKKYLFISVPLFVLGLAAAGVCEYLVQRFTGMYMYIYPGQVAGLAGIIASVTIMYRKVRFNA